MKWKIEILKITQITKYSYLCAEIKYLKSAGIPIFKLNPNRYESDLSNEVLCSLVAQRAAKLWEVKSADLKKIVFKITVDSKTRVPGSSKTVSLSKLQL